VERVAKNVKRRHGGEQAPRRTTTAQDNHGVAGSGKKFRRVEGFRELAALQSKLNPIVDATGPRSRNVHFVESRHFQLSNFGGGLTDPTYV
jgi:hypothetical protein